MMRPFLGSLVAGLALAAGLLTPTAGAASTCGERVTSLPFAAWNDRAPYFLAPNGGFEAGNTSWKLGGGAKVVSGNEPFYVNSAADRSSLWIPSGGWAEMLPFCIDADEPTLRFFARNSGSVLSSLAVFATIRTTVLGVTAETTLPLGVVLGTTTDMAAVAVDDRRALGEPAPRRDDDDQRPLRAAALRRCMAGRRRLRRPVQGLVTAPADQAVRRRSSAAVFSL